MLAPAAQRFCSPIPYVCYKSLNIVKPQYICCLQQQLTPLNILGLWRPITATYLNPVQQAHHWYTPSTIKTVVCVQHVFAENIDLQKTSSFIKLPNTCNRRETVLKGGIKSPDHFHNGLLSDIIRIGAIDFIKNDKDGHQY